MGTTFRGGGGSDALGHLVGRLLWSLRSDAYGRSDVGTTIRGGRSVLASGCRGSALMLADVQTLAQSFGAVGHLVECVPWSLCSDACRRSDVGTTFRGGGRSVLMLTDVRTLAQPFGAVVL